jgi:hypothetical protein
MIRKIGLFIALIALCVSNNAYAAMTSDRVGKWDIGVNVSGAIPTDSDVDSAAYVGGSLSYGVQDWLALGAEAGWAQFGESAPGINLDENAVPIFGDIIFRYPTSSEWKPYAIIGLGVIVWNIDSNISGLNVDVDTAFAAKFGGGVDYFMNDNWALNFEFSYVTSSADATATFNGATATASGDTDYWMVGGGVKYLFS